MCGASAARTGPVLGCNGYAGIDAKHLLCIPRQLSTDDLVTSAFKPLRHKFGFFGTRVLLRRSANKSAVPSRPLAGFSAAVSPAPLKLAILKWRPACNQAFRA